MNILKNKKITLKEAADIAGYSSDYIGSLIRTGKIIGHRLVGTSAWVTTETAVLNYLQENKNSSRMSSRRKHSVSRIQDNKPISFLSNLLSSVPLPLLIAEIISIGIIAITVFGIFYTFYVYSTINDKVVEKNLASQPEKR